MGLGSAFSAGRRSLSDHSHRDLLSTIGSWDHPHLPPRGSLQAWYCGHNSDHADKCRRHLGPCSRPEILIEIGTVQERSSRSKGEWHRSACHHHHGSPAPRKSVIQRWSVQQHQKASFKIRRSLVLSGIVLPLSHVGVHELPQAPSIACCRLLVCVEPVPKRHRAARKSLGRDVAATAPYCPKTLRVPTRLSHIMP